MTRLGVRWLLGGFLLAAFLSIGRAHEIRPAYLEIRELDSGLYSVLWKLPAQGLMRLPLNPLFPERCHGGNEKESLRTASFLVERWTLGCPAGLAGERIAIENLELTLTDALVRIELKEGGARTARLTPSRPELVVAAEAGWLDLARSYMALGVEHILLGIDHLLFVFALLLIVNGARRLLWTVTAFTLAHSLTLAMATLGFVSVPSAPVEAVIALSILFLAVEIVHSRRGAPGLTERRPWLVAFAFGLLHGFGFAGALSQTGLPETAIPAALLFFNVGVELGQAAFIGIVLILAAGVARLPFRLPKYSWAAPVYGIGAIAGYWTIERVLAIFIAGV